MFVADDVHTRVRYLSVTESYPCFRRQSRDRTPECKPRLFVKLIDRFSDEFAVSRRSDRKFRHREPGEQRLNQRLLLINEAVWIGSGAKGKSKKSAKHGKNGPQEQERTRLR